MLNYSANGPSGYNLTNSLRFRSSASAYLNRTFGSTTNRQIFTWSAWVKRGALTIRQHLFVSANPVVNTVFQQEFQVAFDDSNKIQMVGGVSGVGNDFELITTQVFRDPSAWYHIVVAVDTTQATAANRMKLYVNGVQVTSFSTSTYPAQNYNTAVNLINFSNRMGGSGTNYLDAYFTEVNFIDGQSLTPSSFGNTNSVTGVWQPAKYTGTYGTNGFYLNFTDIALTSGSNAGLGKDFSGNGNYYNTNNISVTAGTTYDAMTDVPTLTSATVANYATLNPLFVKGTTPVISNGNMKITGNGNYGYVGSTMSLDSGKWYWEAKMTAGAVALNLGIITTQYPNADFTGTGAVAFNGAGYYCNEAGSYSYNASQPSFTVGDTIGMTFDSSTGEFKFNVNNGSFHTVATKTPDGRSWFPAGNVYASGDQWDFNFGQRPFSYTPPSGYFAMNTFNLPSSTIPQGNKYMDATLWTGNGTSQSIVNASAFKPDFVWVKSRSNAFNNNLFNSTSGVNKFLVSDTTAAEASVSGTLTAFNSNGFSVGSDIGLNFNGGTYVGWQWQAGQGSTSSNTSGSITTTTSVNATAGFSVFTFTGTGASASVGHGLGVAPKFMVFKRRDSTSDWNVLTNAAGSNQYGFLNLTTAFASAGETWTSTVINIGGNFANGATYVCYAWAEIAGFSKFGSYTGNGSADGPFVYLGFRPKFVLLFNTAGGDFWYILDSARDTYNATGLYLYPNVNNAEGDLRSTYPQDFLSNGFKVRNASFPNANGAKIIYAAFAENPFKNALAR
jgi:hypothetical protein